MPQFRSTLTNIAPTPKLPGEHGREKEGGVSTVDRREKESGASTADGKEKESGASTMDSMLLALTSGRHPTIVKMGILGIVLTDTIVDRGSGVNVLPKDTWKKLEQPMLWPPIFQLLMADQHEIKPLRILMAQPVTIGAQLFLLDFVVIPLKRRGYDAILG